MVDDFEALAKRLEPEAVKALGNSDGVLLASIAISLKRIADGPLPRLSEFAEEQQAIALKRIAMTLELHEPNRVAELEAAARGKRGKPWWRRLAG